MWITNALPLEMMAYAFGCCFVEDYSRLDEPVFVSDVLVSVCEKPVLASEKSV